jgi:hypothetical protein
VSLALQARIRVMRVLRVLATTTLWVAICAVLPAGLLFPIARWASINTSISEKVITQSYGMAIAVLFLPTCLLVDFLYRRFILKKRPSN